MLDSELKKKAIDEIKAMLEGRMGQRLKPKMMSIEIEAKGGKMPYEMEMESEDEGEGKENGEEKKPMQMGMGYGMGAMKEVVAQNPLEQKLPEGANLAALSPKEQEMLKMLYEKMGA